MRRPAEPVCPTSEAVIEWGTAAGLDAVGIAPASPMLRARAAIAQRVAAGYDAGLPFTFRNPDRSTDPGRAVRDAAAVVVGARRYLLAGDVLGDEVQPKPGHASIARYAWLDHYGPLRESLRTVAGRLRRDGWHAVAFADDNSIVDREIAWLGGLGWFGKNANLLLPGAGSWFVLGCVITDAPLEAASEPAGDGCGPCRRCLSSCPTGAIVSPGVVDASRCLAWLLQRPGVFPVAYRVALGRRIYGCDDCQEVCPPNVRDGKPRPAVEGDESPLASVPIVELLTASDAALLERHGRWYIHERDPRWIRRNALVILGNVGVEFARPLAESLLARYLGGDDGLLVAHAIWAARRLDRGDLIERHRQRWWDDDATIAAELAHDVPPLRLVHPQEAR